MDCGLRIKDGGWRIEAKSHRDDPDEEDCVPEEDDQHRQLHQPEIQELFLLGKQTILNMHTYKHIQTILNVHTYSLYSVEKSHCASNHLDANPLKYENSG